MAQANNYANVYAPASSTYYYIIEVAVKEESYSVDTNKSRLYLEADITGNGIRFSGSEAQSLAVYWHDSKNGDMLGASTTYTSINRDELNQITGYIDVPHNNDGTLSGYAYTVWTKNGSNSYVPPTTTVQANLTLTTIPRASVLSITGTPNIGSQITINTNRKSTNFTHLISYTFGSLHEIIATNVGESTQWTIPTTFYAQIPNATSGTMNLTCQTYNGSTPVGYTTISVTVYVNQNTAKTTISNVTWTIDNTTNTKTGATNKYIKNFSTITVKCGSVTNSFNSPIRSIILYKIIGTNETPIETKSYSSSTTSYSNVSFTAQTGLSCDSLKVRAIDARGIQSDLVTVGIQYVNYVLVTRDTQPTIVRTSQTGSVAKITSFKGNYWNGNFGASSNSLTIRWRYRVSGGSYGDWYTIPDASISKSNNQYSITNYTFTNGTTTNLFTYTSLYDIEFEVKDGLKTVTPNTVFRLSRGVPNFVIFQNKLQKNGEDIITSLVTTSANGYMSSTDKSKLNGIANNANNYSLPTASTSTKGGIKVGNNLTISNEVLSMSPTNLYNNTTGSTSSVTLSQSAANFTYLEIHYKVLNVYYSTKVYSPNGKLVGLFGVTNENTVMQIGSASAGINGTTINISNAQMANIASGTCSNWNASNISIVRVDGYK